ncbi:unnamed protein product [Miscanthus lutarioriparius]|uniref:Pentatricopeptide repeat-containing protein n=1 Tax=Miscanthus lutarioriparius TaxID=422564 RepID=A0A811NP61_9POAL|nr:unnamed protein product [Miscanthus lutarioriparius]
MESAMRVYEKMCKSGVYPDLRTFETLIWGYSEQNQPWKDEEVLQMMRETGVKPKQSTYCLIADAWKAVGLIENTNNSNGSPNGPYAIDKLGHSDDSCNVQISEDNNKLQSFGESNGRAIGRSRSSFFQIKNALGSSGIVSAKVMQGLLDKYTLTRHKKGLENVVSGVADQLFQLLWEEPDTLLHYFYLETLGGNKEATSGFNDVMIASYSLQKDQKHLTLAHLLDKPCFLGLKCLLG